MSEPFVAEIRILGCNFAPTGWAQCNGQILPISQNTALFSLLGTQYGGNGSTNFALPDLQGAAPMNPGQGPGLTLRNVGETGGAQTVTLLSSEMPAHTHTMTASLDDADLKIPTPGRAMAKSAGGSMYQTGTPALSALAPEAVPPVGGGQPHNNMQPYLALNFCIALQGIFPPRP